MFPDILQSAIVGMMVAIPTIVVYKKAGLHPAWAALVFLPVFGLHPVLPLAGLPYFAKSRIRRPLGIGVNGAGGEHHHDLGVCLQFVAEFAAGRETGMTAFAGRFNKAGVAAMLPLGRLLRLI